jgi:integrase
VNTEIKVTVCRYPDRPNLVLAYIDPVSGKRKTKSAGTAKEKDAWKAAAAWEEALRAGPHCPLSKVTWHAFRQRYEAEHLASLSRMGRDSARFHLNQLEKHLNPDRLCKVTASALSTFQTRLRATGIRETSIASSLRAIKAALSWGVSVGMLAAVPRIVMPKGSKGRKMKGGALLGEQFDLLLAAVPKVRPKDSAEWVRYLTGVWLSGLRLGESVALSWDADAPFAVDLSGRRPRFRIRGESQKSGRDELTPMTPDFAQWLLNSTPAGQRRGRAFRLNQDGGTIPLDVHHVGQIVAKIGHKAGVVVGTAEKKVRRDGQLVPVVVKKFASIHDLRRTFGTRWSRQVMPAVLQRLMRHANVQTTMQYYVDLDADSIADDLWANHPATAGDIPAAGNISRNIGPESAEADGSPDAVTPIMETACYPK